jgi:hypothetical protein
LATCTVWLAIDDATVENGCLRFIKGSHIDQKLKSHNINNDQNLTLNQELMKEEYEDGTERLKIFNELIDSFSYIVSINNSVISLSLDVARKQLEEALIKLDGE